MRHYPHWLVAFTDFASYSEAPNKMLYWTGVSTLAGALRRRVWIDQKYFTWTPNFYIVLVAPPGIVSKSTTINIGMNLLRRIPGVNFGPDVITWEALIQSLEKYQELVPIPGTIDMMPMSCVTVASDEFGTFLDPNDRDMIDVMVTLWDGKRGTFTKVTKTSGNDVIENPWINLIGCTTPSWIGHNFPEYMIGGGFTSRCVFLYADAKRQLVPYPARNVPKDFERNRDKLTEDLEHISKFFGEYALTPKAIAWGEQWYDTHWNKTRSGNLVGSEYEGYIARKQTHIHKLGMIIAASKRDEPFIDKDDLHEAEVALVSTEGELVKVFKGIGQSPTTRIASTLVDMVAKAGPVPKLTLFNAVFRFASHNEFEVALLSAIMAGKLRQTPDGKIHHV